MTANKARDLLVTDEYFDYLRSEADRPARIPNPKMVSFFRSMRGAIKHTRRDES